MLLPILYIFYCFRNKTSVPVFYLRIKYTQFVTYPQELSSDMVTLVKEAMLAYLKRDTPLLLFSSSFIKI